MGVQPPNLNALRKFILSNGPYAWWAADPDLCTDGAGLTQVGYDLVGNRAETFAVGKRPAHIVSNPLQPCWRFTGAEVGIDAGGLLTGLDGATFILVWKDAGVWANYQLLFSYSPDGGGLANGAARVGTNITDGFWSSSCCKAAGFNIQAATVAAGTADFHVLAQRQKFSDGAAALVPIREDGSNQAGANNGFDVSGVTFGNFYCLLGAVDSALGAFAYPGHGDLSDLLVCPYYDDATADLMQRALQSLRSTP